MLDPDRIDDVLVSIDPDETHSIHIQVVGWDTEGKRLRERVRVNDFPSIQRIAKAVNDAMVAEGLIPPP